MCVCLLCDPYDAHASWAHFAVHPSAVSIYMRLFSYGQVSTLEFTYECVCVRLQMSVRVHESSGVWRVIPLVFSVSGFFISSTLLCAPPKQRPCRDTETLNYLLYDSIKHEYQLHVPAAIIHTSVRKWVLLIFPRMLRDDVKGPSASAFISTAFLTCYHGDKTWNSVIKDKEEELDKHRFVKLE